MSFHHYSFYLHQELFINSASTYTVIFPPYDRRPTQCMWYDIPYW